MGSKSSAPKLRPSHKVHFRKWHRRLGFLAAIFLLNLSVTGILLNHYTAFSFHEKFIESSLILDLYGIQAPDDAECLAFKNIEACVIGEQYYLNGDYWKDSNSELLYFGQLESDLVLISQSDMYWLTPDLQLVDSISITSDVSYRVFEASIINGSILIQTQQGQYQFNANTFSWKPKENKASIKTQVKESPNQVLLEKLQQNYKQRQVTELRFIQDLHSGAIVGLSGKVTNDITALIIIWLVVSGFVTWYRRKNKG